MALLLVVHLLALHYDLQCRKYYRKIDQKQHCNSSNRELIINRALRKVQTGQDFLLAGKDAGNLVTI